MEVKKGNSANPISSEVPNTETSAETTVKINKGISNVEDSFQRELKNQGSSGITGAFAKPLLIDFSSKEIEQARNRLKAEKTENVSQKNEKPSTED